MRDGDAAVGTRQLFRKNMFVAADHRHGHQARCQLQCGGDGLLEARGYALLDEQAVDDHFDGVIFALVQRRGRVQRIEFTVDAHANVAVQREFFQLFAVGALPAAHDGRENHDAVVGLAQFAVQDGLHDLLGGLPGDGLAAIWAMRHADRRVHDAQVIVNFRDGADGGARRARGGFLLDGDGRREAFDYVHFGTFHLIEKLPRISRQRFHVAALAFRIDGVEGQ